MAKISRDLSAGNLHPRENIALTGSITAVNGTVTINADGCATTTVLVGAGLTGTLVVEGAIDSTSWQTIPMRALLPGGGFGAFLQLMVLSGVSAVFTGACPQFTQLRVRCSAYTSGSASVTLAADNAITSVDALLRASDGHATNTGAAAAAVTLTLPAPPVGLFHHITRLIIQRHAAALLTAAATPVIVTTTNLPGSRAFSIPADAAAQGAVYSEIVEPATPMRSSASATATTIVCPVTTGVIWRVSADFITAP